MRKPQPLPIGPGTRLSNWAVPVNRAVPAVFASAVLVVPLAACAQDSTEDYPERPIELTVGWSAGGSSDLAARALGQGIEDQLGESVQVVNVEGATGGVGASEVYHQPPEGYHIFGGASTAGMWGVMEQADVGWEDFYALLAGPSPSTIYVSGDSDYETIDDLVEALEEEPGMRYGTPGPGSNGHIFGEILAEEAGVDVEHVPYDGGSEAGRYLMSGEVEFTSVTLGDMVNLIDSDDARPLVNLHDEPVEVGGIEIDPITDYYPELAESIAINPWFGLYVSRETPPEIVQQLSDAVEVTTESDEFHAEYEEEYGGIVDFTVGQEADEVMARVESSRSWELYDLGVAEMSPEELDIPHIDDFSWPPHDRAEEANDWP